MNQELLNEVERGLRIMAETISNDLLRDGLNANTKNRFRRLRTYVKNREFIRAIRVCSILMEYPSDRQFMRWWVCEAEVRLRAYERVLSGHWYGTPTVSALRAAIEQDAAASIERNGFE